MSDYKIVLENLGYKLKDDGQFWRSTPLYRDSGNPTSLRVSKKTGWFNDFSENIGGPFQYLVQLTLGLKNGEDAIKWLRTQRFAPPKNEEKPLVSMSESWDRSVLANFIRTHGYWEKRGISSDTVSRFEGGVVIKGRLADRYVFPIFDKRERIIGFAGRDLTNTKKAKWKLIGSKKSWVFPIFHNREFIQTVGEVILVEGISDVLQLWQYGYENALSLFGVEISDKIVSTLAGMSLDKVIISTNNDITNGGVGNRAAAHIYEKIIKFINPAKVQIKLPLKNDFQEMNQDEIKEWKSKKNLAIIGSRDFKNRELFKSAMLGKTDDVGMIVSGGAEGADTLAKEFGHFMNIPVVEFIPDWDKLGKKAGFVRNEHIINNADKVIAFHDGISPGTSHSIETAIRNNKPLEIIRF